eukprot:6534581-Ditylum_brightwellii.AAC.1
MQGSAGHVGVDAVAWQDWLLQFGAANTALRETMSRLACWLDNTRPAWAACRAIVAGRLIMLDKCPGIRPVGVGRFSSNCWGIVIQPQSRHRGNNPRHVSFVEGAQRRRQLENFIS